MSLLSRISRRAGLIKPRARGSLVKHRLWSSFTQGHEEIRIDALDASFPYLWLRDSCLSPECIHPSTSQKLHRSSDIPLDVRPAQGGVKLQDDGLHIRWADGHTSFFPRGFLYRHSSSLRLDTFHRDLKIRPWDATTVMQNKDLFVSYESLQERAGLRAAIDQLCTAGLLFVTGVPNAETSDAKCELRTLASKFSHIRETFYGQVWDVVNVPNSRNIAYTNLDLGLHMDLLYMQNPPKYQILHCLRNDVDGGSSLFVDGFHAAAALDPASLETLAETPVAFHYINDGHHLHHEHRTLERSPSNVVEQINYSPPFQAPLRLNTPPKFYQALAKFASLLNDDARRIKYTLREGDAVIFDNRRVLHARTAFTDREGPGGSVVDGEPNRWLKGCYFEADALLDRGRMLRKELLDAT